MNKEEFVKRMEKIREERAKAYKDMDLDKKLMLNIAVLGRRSFNAVDKKGSQNRVLMLLNETGPMSQRDLTHRLGIQPGSASEILKKLEDAYLIERVFDENDRRGKLVRLTDNGKLLADSLAAKNDANQNDVFSALDVSEKETFLNLLEKVNKDWQARFPMGPDAHMRHHGGFGHRGPCGQPFGGPEGFGPHGPEGFGPHGPEDFGPHGPEDFGPHGPERFGREFHGDMDRKGPGHFRREFHGDMDRKGPDKFDREYHGDMDRKEPENPEQNPENKSERKGPGDFNPTRALFFARKRKPNRDEMA